MQSSDITYRLYDYNRQRENSSSLDVDKALDVIQYSQELPSIVPKMKLLKIINAVTLCLMISLQWLNGKLVGH